MLPEVTDVRRVPAEAIARAMTQPLLPGGQGGGALVLAGVERDGVGQSNSRERHLAGSGACDLELPVERHEWPGELAARLSKPFFFSSRRRHTRCSRDWSSDVCSSD